MSEHSPGPWTYAKTGEWVDVFDANGVRIIRGEPRHTSWAEPNARLIVDAPTTAAERDELLAALEKHIGIGGACEICWRRVSNPRADRAKSDCDSCAEARALINRVRSRIDGRAVTGAGNREGDHGRG